MRRRPLLGALSALSLSAAVVAVATPAHADPTVEVLAGGLVGPLSLAVDDDGTQYVTENFTGRLYSQPAGATNALQQVYKSPGGVEVGGVSVADGVLRFTVSSGESNDEGRVSTLRANGKAKLVADTGDYERANNPDGDVAYGFRNLAPSCVAQLPQEFPPSRYLGVVETHPYGTDLVGTTTYVADAAGNDILAIAKNGTVRTVAVIPPRSVTISAETAENNGLPPCTVGKKYRFEGVPTDVEMGPDGFLYVSTLAGGPEDGSTSTGQVLRINPTSGTINTVVDGLVSATGVAVADNGDIYVSQLFPGQISKVPAGTKTLEPFATVPLPADVDVADGVVYAAINVLPGGDGPPDGQLVRITPGG